MGRAGGVCRIINLPFMTLFGHSISGDKPEYSIASFYLVIIAFLYIFPENVFR